MPSMLIEIVIFSLVSRLRADLQSVDSTRPCLAHPDLHRSRPLDARPPRARPPTPGLPHAPPPTPTPTPAHTHTRPHPHPPSHIRPPPRPATTHTRPPTPGP